MKILVIGNGARESALLWKLHVDWPTAALYCLPGNGGTAQVAINVDLALTDNQAIVDFAKSQGIDMTIVGPELPLVNGLVDLFRTEKLAIVGPDKRTAQLEGSKIFAKQFMNKYGLPTADYQVYHDFTSARAGLIGRKYPFVMKADGLAAGKGVLIIRDREEALAGLNLLMVERRFGEAGDGVIFEDYIVGTEVSLICLVDGQTIVPLDSARDYKRAYDNDRGPNTGGMGGFSPNPILVNNQSMAIIEEEILQPFLKGIQAEKMDYRGILFLGLMLTENGVKVLEFNVRFGDPETEVLLPRLKSSLPELMQAVIEKRLAKVKIEWTEQVSVAVVLAAEGYPTDYQKGQRVMVDSLPSDSLIFYGGVGQTSAGQLMTAGGRVLVVVALAAKFDEARTRAYQAVNQISFSGGWYRTDIAKRVGYQTEEI